MRNQKKVKIMKSGTGTQAASVKHSNENEGIIGAENQNNKQSRKIYFYFGSYRHPFYESLISNPPSGFSYVASATSTKSAAFGKFATSAIFATSAVSNKPVSTQLAHVSKTRTQTSSNSFVRNSVLKLAKFLGNPKFAWLSESSLAKSSLSDCVGIHAAQYLLYTNKPYVVDFEDVSAFTYYDHRVLRKVQTQYLLHKFFCNPACKAILPWTEAAKKSLLNAVTNSADFAHKVHVVYPCIAPISKDKLDSGKLGKLTNLRNKGAVRLLFVGKLFYEKGGYETVIAFSRLRKQYPQLELDVVSHTPDEILEQFKDVPGLRFRRGIADDILESLYCNADIFVMPSHYDTFGFVYLQAMAHGVPCVGADQFATREIITHGKTGLLVKNTISRFDARMVPTRSLATSRESQEFVTDCKNVSEQKVVDLTSTLKKLIVDVKFRKRLGVGAYREICNGKFSLPNRTRRLSKVYDDAFKR